MVRLVIVTALLSLLLLGESLRQGAQLRIGFGAGAGQIPKGPLHPAGVHLRQIEMGLFVTQDRPALRAVVQDDPLDPGLPRPESGNRPKLEHSAFAYPACVQRVRHLRALRAVRRRGPLEVAPDEPPPGGPRKRVVVSQIALQQLVQRTRRCSGRRPRPGGTWGRAPSRRRDGMAGAPESPHEQDRNAESHGRVTIRPRGGIPASSSRIPTLGGIPNRGAPAPPGFITVTVLSTSSSSGRWLCPKMMISASGKASCNLVGLGLPNWSPWVTTIGKPSNSISATCGSCERTSKPSLLPYTAVTGASARSSTKRSLRPTSPPCRM